MNVLVLGPYRKPLEELFLSQGDTCHFYEDKLIAGAEILQNIDWILSFGYRHILKSDVLSKFDKRILNIHISYLPWNRGADPNLWSFLENTPKGVTLHFIDASIDTGDIIAQKKVEFNNKNETLKSSYEKLIDEGIALVVDEWPHIKKGSFKSHPQPTGGSLHRLKDKEIYLGLLEEGWDTPVHKLVGKALVNR